MTPKACTIAGSDSSGGSGIQGDLKTFQSFGVHGLSVVTAVTAQHMDEVEAVFPIPPEFVSRQLEAVFNGTEVGGVKTGMMAGEGAIRAAARFLSVRQVRHLVMDPVIQASDGHPLLEESAVETLISELIPLAEIVTPNIPEAERLSGISIDSPADMERAARRIRQLGCGAVLVKGGHLKGDALDIWFDGGRIQEMVSPRVPGPGPRGTGCALSAAILSGLVLGLTPEEAVKRAKRYITLAIRDAYDTGDGVRFLPHSVPSTGYEP
jgi:hydroxymethylpyrimidine/phosphomethylpyrimidine kinase